VNVARAANLALKFVLELAALAAFATWRVKLRWHGVAVLRDLRRARVLCEIADGGTFQAAATALG
jgi:hypothetical protein